MVLTLMKAAMASFGDGKSSSDRRRSETTDEEEIKPSKNGLCDTVTVLSSFETRVWPGHNPIVAQSY